jgi:ligand-binding sensor domain-containing protein
VTQTQGWGWTTYVSINQINDVIFASDGTLWASIWTGLDGGLVHWDPKTASYTWYLIDARDIAPAPDDSLWLVTGKGVCHFDSATCRMYDETQGLPADGARVLAVGPDGTVWASTTAGIYRFDGRRWQYQLAAYVGDLVATPNGHVWAATSTGVHHYIPSEDAWTTYGPEAGLPASTAVEVAAGPDGVVWASFQYEGVYRLDAGDDRGSWTKVQAACGSPVSDIAVAADGTPWIASAGGMHYPGGCLAHYNGRSWNDLAEQHDLLSVSTIALGLGGEIAAGTSQGLWVLKDGDGRYLKDGPTRQRVTAVAVTPDGSAWFGFGDGSATTPGGGLSRFDGHAWEYRLGDAEVNVLAVAPDGHLWAGAGCAVLRYDGQAWRNVDDCGGALPVGNVLDIAFVPDGVAWVANGFGLGRFDGSNWQVYDKLVNSLAIGPDGALWANGWEGRQGSNYVARFDGEVWTTYKLSDSPLMSFTAGAAVPPNWMCGVVQGGGLACFDGSNWADDKAWRRYGLPATLSAEQEGRPAAAPDGAVWLATSSGLARFDRPGTLTATWTLYPIALDGPAIPASAIAFGLEGSVWVGSSRLQP